MNIVSLVVLWTLAALTPFFSAERAISALPAIFVSVLWLELTERTDRSEAMVYLPPFLFALALLVLGIYVPALGCAFVPTVRFLKKTLFGKEVLSIEYAPAVFLLLSGLLTEKLSAETALIAGVLLSIVSVLLFETTGVLVDKKIFGEKLSGLLKSSIKRMQRDKKKTKKGEKSLGPSPLSRKDRKKLRSALDGGQITFDDLAVLWAHENDSEKSSTLTEKTGEVPEESPETDREEPPGDEGMDGAEGEKEPETERLPSESVQVPVKQTAEASHPGFENEHVIRIYRDYVLNKLSDPRFKPFVEAATRLLSLLDEVSDVPSVTTSKEDEDGLPQSSYDLLKKVTLAEHTLHVVEYAERFVRDEFGETYLIVWPSLLLVSVAHDLGKAPSLRGNLSFYYGSHARISAEILSRCCESLHPDQKQTLYEVVLYHHGDTKKLSGRAGRLLELLKKADALARNDEWTKLTRETPGAGEIKADAVLKKLFDFIHNEMEEGRVKRYPFLLDERDGILYVSPVLFLKALREVVEEEKIYLPEIFSSDDVTVASRVSAILIEKFSDYLPADFLETVKNTGRFFVFKHVLLDGSPRGRKTFVPLLLVPSTEAVGIGAEEFVSRMRESAFIRLEAGKEI